MSSKVKSNSNNSNKPQNDTALPPIHLDQADLIQAQQHRPKEGNNQNDTASASSSSSCTKDKHNGNNGKEHGNNVKMCTDSVSTQIPMRNRFAVLESSNDS
ncbi:unnamed protein product [Cochlearia groenlandica]